MLFRKGELHEVRQFGEPATGDSGATALCARCTREVFNHAFHERLRTAWEKKLDEDGIEYTVSSQELYRSVTSGCRWCASIANAILTSVQLDYCSNVWAEDSDDDSDDSNATASVGVHSVDGSGRDDPSDLPSAAAEEDADGWDEILENPTLDLLLGDVEIRNRVVFHRDRKAEVYGYIECTVEMTRMSSDSVLPSLEEDDAVVVSFEIISPDSPIFRDAWPTLSPTDFDTWVPMAKKWIDACKAHVSCRSHGKALPSRLICVGEIDQSKPARIVVSSTEGDYAYVALSYVRGGPQTYGLTSSNLKGRMESLDLNELPQTIVDAINVTRNLGYSYLWIDALCILQDSRQDEQLELLKMRDIYKNSALVLQASTASTPTEGFLKPLDTSSVFIQPFDITFDLGDKTSPPITLAYRQSYQPAKDPINSRAWTLQERVMPTRVLSFSYDGLKWACKTCGIDPNAGRKAPPPLTTSFHPRNKSPDVTEQDIASEFWYQMRREYTSRRLTYPTDKLPAISAIASDVARRTDWTYLAGLWKENLFSDLHWKVDKSYADPSIADSNDYVAPSWSWASVSTGMVADTEDYRPYRQSFAFRILSDSLLRDRDSLSVFGRIAVAKLKVEAKKIELYWELCEDIGSDITLLARSAGEDESYEVGSAVRDRVDWGIAADETVTCLAISRLVYDGNEQDAPVEGILVMPAHASAWKRVGYFRIESARLFDVVAAEGVELV